MSNKILISPIKNELDYENTLNRIDEIFDAELNTIEADELDILVTLVEKYEEEKYPILPPDPIEAIKFRMEQMNMTKSDLSKIIGSNRVSEILSRKRKMSMSIVKKIHESLKIPLEVLLA
jgi:HTH-type transcriptional regulator/antitoxin HigA